MSLIKFGIKYQINSDYEGEFSPNDAALDAFSHILFKREIVDFLEEGRMIYRIISTFDDVSAELRKGMKDAPEILKELDYTSGDTLRLVPVFMRALGVTDKELMEIYKEIGEFYPGAIEGAKDIQKKLGNELNIISTSWLDFLYSMNDGIVPREHIYGTPMELDRYKFAEKEKGKILDSLREMIKLKKQGKLIEIVLEKSDGTDITSYDELSKKQKEAYEIMEEIFWKDLAEIPTVMQMYKKINPRGSIDKAKAVEDAVKKANILRKKTIGVGDSSTDRKMLNLIRENGGITLTHNAKGSAIKYGEFNLITENYYITVPLVAIANAKGKDGLIDLARNWDYYNLLDELRKSVDKKTYRIIRHKLYDIFVFGRDTSFAKFTYIPDLTNEEFKKLQKENNEIRAKLRGESRAKIR